MAPSNTKEAFRELVGKRIKGVLFNALPLGRCDLARGTKTLVFEDGSGFTVASNGSFWHESPEEISRAIQQARQELEAAQRDIQDALIAAGEGGGPAA